MLALVGSGEYLPAMQAVDQYLLGQLQAEASVICLPTAAGSEGDERIAYWSELGKAHFSRLGVKVEALKVIDTPSANRPEFADKIRLANFIYLSGGKPDYLFRTLNGSLVWDAIMDVCNKGGVLAGCSAGAMIMGERLPAFPGTKPAFGLLPGAVIIPHFDEIPKALIHSLRLLVRGEHTLLGIDGNTALVGNDGEFQVRGSGGVMVWNKQGKKRFTEGEQVSWR